MSEQRRIGLKQTDIVAAYTLLRLIVGVNYFNHGFTRIASIPNFVQSMVEQFQDTFIPGFLVAINAALVPPVELIVGLLITIGLFTRAALVACLILTNEGFTGAISPALYLKGERRDTWTPRACRFPSMGMRQAFTIGYGL